MGASQSLKEAEATMKMHVERAAEKVAAHEKTLSMSVNSNKSGNKLIDNSGKLVCGSAGNQEPSDEYMSSKSGKLIGNSGKLVCGSAGNI